jgi:hypothetical protein
MAKKKAVKRDPKGGLKPGVIKSEREMTPEEMRRKWKDV